MPIKTSCLLSSHHSMFSQAPPPPLSCGPDFFLEVRRWILLPGFPATASASDAVLALKGREDGLHRWPYVFLLFHIWYCSIEWWSDFGQLKGCVQFGKGVFQKYLFLTIFFGENVNLIILVSFSPFGIFCLFYPSYSPLPFFCSFPNFFCLPFLNILRFLPLLPHFSPYASFVT